MNGTSPLFTIFVRPSREGVYQVQAFLDAFNRQSYRNCEVILLNVPLEDAAAFEALSFAKDIPVFALPAHDASSVDALNLCRGEYFFFFEVDDLLEPDALNLIAREIAQRRRQSLPNVIIFDYSVREGRQLMLLPGWDPDLIQYNDYIKSAASFSTNFVRRISDQLSSFSPFEIAKATECNNGSVLHIARTLLRTEKKTAEVRPFQLDCHTNLPVSVIIPNKNGIHLLTRCLQVFKKFMTPFEIIVVDNESQDPRTWQMYSELERQFDITILSFNHTFNYSAMINLGVKRARYDFIFLLNNDVFIDNPQTILTAVNYASKSGVGVVGSVLRYIDGRVQHAGMVLSRPAPNDCDITHVLRFAKHSEEFHTGALTSPRNWLSVTGAFQMMRKEVFEAVGGYDEVNLPIEFNDVDFCLRARSKGLRVVCLPFEGIVHDESQTRSKIDDSSAKRFSDDAYNVMRLRWLDVYDNDPYYNAQLRKTAAEKKIAVRLSSGFRFVRSALRSLRPRKLVTKNSMAMANFRARAEMPLRLRSGICVVSPLRANSSRTDAAIILGNACRAAALEVSFYDTSRAFVSANMNEIPLEPFPNQLVTLYLGSLSELGKDRYHLGEGRTRILLLSDDTESIVSGAEEYLDLFDQIWTLNETAASRVTSLTDTSVRIVPHPFHRLITGGRWGTVLMGSADHEMETEKLGKWLKSEITDLIVHEGTDCRLPKT